MRTLRTGLEPASSRWLAANKSQPFQKENSMFSKQTETELRRNLQWETGMQGLVTLPADA